MQQRGYARWLVPAVGGALLLSSAACNDNDINAVILVATSITVSSGNGQVAAVDQSPLYPPDDLVRQGRIGARRERGRVTGPPDLDVHVDRHVRQHEGRRRPALFP